MDPYWNDWKDVVFDVVENENPCVVLLFIDETSATLARLEMTTWKDITIIIQVQVDKKLTITVQETNGRKGVALRSAQTIYREHVVNFIELSPIIRYPIYFGIIDEDDLRVIPQEEWSVFGKGYEVIEN